MKTFTRLLALLTIFAVTHACTTDFDITADYKEVVIVYGLLSQNDTTHYLRINKAFLGEGNALTYAGIADSSFLGNDVEVKLIEKNNSAIIREILFDTITIHNKETGEFYAPDQLVYKADAILNPDYTYELRITNKKTGNEVNAITNLVHDFDLTKPSAPQSTSPKIDFKRDTFSVQKIEWSSAVNGRLYQPMLTFYFKEVYSNGDTVTRSLPRTFSSSISNDLTGGEKMLVEYRSEDFFLLCEDQIPYADQQQEESVIRRLADHFDITFTVVGDEFNTYLDVNGPTTGLLLEKPSYTNINNGLGVFSSKYTKKVYCRVGNNLKAALQNQTTLGFFAD